jgi:hypothetical protein
VPSVRFSRDKRGYEYVYLVHTPIRRGKQGRTRVLYWYRTPPGVRIGRKPFDEEVQRTLEQQNPGLTFDWEAIIGTPMPPPDMTEVWRERRRVEKLARQERRALEAQSAGDTVEGREADQASTPDSDLAPGADPQLAGLAAESDSMSSDEATPIVADTGASAPAARKRRRRRGGRRQPSETGDSSSEVVSSGDPDDPPAD